MKANGIQVYDCQQVNQVVHTKNLMEYSPSYAKQTTTNELFYLDTSRHAEERVAQDNYIRVLS